MLESIPLKSKFLARNQFIPSQESNPSGSGKKGQGTGIMIPQEQENPSLLGILVRGRCYHPVPSRQGGLSSLVQGHLAPFFVNLLHPISTILSTIQFNYPDRRVSESSLNPLITLSPKRLLSPCTHKSRRGENYRASGSLVHVCLVTVLLEVATGVYYLPGWMAAAVLRKIGIKLHLNLLNDSF